MMKIKSFYEKMRKVRLSKKCKSLRNTNLSLVSNNCTGGEFFMILE